MDYIDVFIEGIENPKSKIEKLKEKIKQLIDIIKEKIQNFKDKMLNKMEDALAEKVLSLPADKQIELGKKTAMFLANIVIINAKVKLAVSYMKMRNKENMEEALYQIELALGKSVDKIKMPAKKLAQQIIKDKEKYKSLFAEGAKAVSYSIDTIKKASKGASENVESSLIIIFSVLSCVGKLIVEFYKAFALFFYDAGKIILEK